MALTKITPQMFDTSAAGHDFNIDNGTFFVDASADRVGIGTTTPSTLLDVNGVLTATSIAGTLTTAAQTNITSVGTLTGLAVTGDTTITKESPAFTLTDSSSSRTLLHFVDDNNSVVRASGPLLLQSGGAVSTITLDASQRVGINNGSPSAKLDVIANDTVWVGEFTQSNTSNGDGVIVTVGSTAAADYALSIRSDAGNTGAFNVKADGNVGVGTFAPPHKFSVFGTGAGNATVQIEGEGGADPYINFLANNTQHWSAGIDDSDSDKFKISKHSALGTNDYLTIDTSGNVGIDNTSPAHRLHIQGATNDQARVRVSNTSTGQASLDLNNTEGYFRTFTDAGEYRIYDQTDGTYRLIIDTSGNVGIGTASPAQTLAVLKNTNYNPPGLGASAGHFFFGKQDGSGAGSYGLIGGTAGTGNSWLQAQRIDGTATSYNLLLQPSGGNVGIGLTSGISSKLHVNTEMSLGADGNNRGIINYSSNILSFGTRQSSTNYFNTVKITSGLVGIGTTPSYSLHVSASGNIPAVLDSSANETYLYIRNSNATTGRKTYVAFAPANNIHGAAIYAEAMADFSTSANRTADLAFETRNSGTITERMRILAGGDVGVGTQSVFGAASNRRCFSINGTSSTSLNIGVGGAQKAYMYSEGTYARVATMGQIPLHLGTNDTERMRITEGSSADSVVIWNNASNSSTGRNFRVMAYDSDSYFSLGNTGNNSIKLIMTNSAGATKFSADAHSGVVSIGGTLYMNSSIYHSGGDRINFVGSNYYVLNASNVGVRLINGNTSWTTQSDERTKENITDIGSVLSKIKNYRCIEYNLKSYDKKMYGFIAQDWETDFPHLVDEDDNFTIQSDGTAKAKDAEDNTSTDAVKTLSYNETIPVLLRAIQEQQELIEALQAEVKALKGE